MVRVLFGQSKKTQNPVNYGVFEVSLAQKNLVHFGHSFDALGADIHLFAINFFCLQVDVLSSQSFYVGVRTSSSFG